MRTLPLLWACGVIVACSSSASAADLSRPVYKAAPYYSPAPVFSWTGFYAGLHGGYGWSKFSGTAAAAGTTDVDAKGWLGGVQLGYNYQFGSYVVGAEGDFSWADVKYEEANTLGPGSQAKLKNDYFATAALRLGYAFDRTLIYAKGGAAWTRDKYDITDGVGGFANGTFNRFGWMIGGGVEYAFWDNISAKLEYNYLSFKTISEQLTTGGGLAAGPADVGLKSHLLKLGLNYRF